MKINDKILKVMSMIYMIAILCHCAYSVYIRDYKTAIIGNLVASLIFLFTLTLKDDDNR